MTHDPLARSAAMPGVDCPFCGIGMSEQLKRGLLVDRCGSCGGRWFDRTELETWLTRVGVACGDADGWVCEPLPRDHRRCPRCRGWTLQAYRCGDLECHRCTTCRGAFVRPGEVERLRATGGSPSQDARRGRFWRLLRLALRPRPNWRQILDRFG
ncbi:MAG: zf-TFIIB domain-containing protein [Planctomycetes bacterium]|nr:zf-TFIIB domain-containing protein [Planctomycetota bacterium]